MSAFRQITTALPSRADVPEAGGERRMLTLSGHLARAGRADHPEGLCVKNFPKRRSGMSHNAVVPTAIATPIHSHP